MPYSKKERSEIVELFILSSYSYARFGRKYRAGKFKVKYPSSATVRRFLKRFREANLEIKRLVQDEPAISEEKIEEIKEHVDEYPEISLRRRFQVFYMPFKSMWRIFKQKLKLKPFKITKVFPFFLDFMLQL